MINIYKKILTQPCWLFVVLLPQGYLFWLCRLWSRLEVDSIHQVVVFHLSWQNYWSNVCYLVSTQEKPLCGTCYYNKPPFTTEIVEKKVSNYFWPQILVATYYERKKKYGSVLYLNTVPTIYFKLTVQFIEFVIV